MAKKLLKLSTLLGVVLVIFLLAGCPLTQPKVALTVSEEGNGEVTLNPSGGTYAKDTEVTLTAVADEGWKFIEWSGDLSGSDNPETLVMDEDKSVTAHFEEKAPKPTITFVDVPESVCGGEEFEAVVEVLNADEVDFALERESETPIEPEVAEAGNLYTLTFESPELTENKMYNLAVYAENEDETSTKSVGILITKVDNIPPYLTVTIDEPDCDATQTFVQFEVCDETALDVNSLTWETSHGTAIMTTEPTVEENCLTRGELTWEFGDIDCEEIDITLKIFDVCGNEASDTKVLDIDNVKPEIDFPVDPGECDIDEEVIEWTVYENCLESFEIFTCCEAVTIEYSDWDTEEILGGRDINTGTATLTFNNVEDCTDFDFEVTAIDECGNVTQDTFTISKDLRDPRIRVYGFLNEEHFTPHLATLASGLLGIFDLMLYDEEATPININDPYIFDYVDEEELPIGPECDDKKAYFIWIAEDDCLAETDIAYGDEICRTGQKVESFTAIPGVVVGYQRVDFNCDIDCEEIEGLLTVLDECGNDATGEATIVVDNLAPEVEWEIDPVACGATETTISWDATDGSGLVHVFIEASNKRTSYYSTDSIGSLNWDFEGYDCEDLTATITVFDDCDDCWGYCGPPNGDTNELTALNNLPPCGGNYFQDSETITVDNVEPEVEDLESGLVGAGETSCGFTKAFFSFAATENCIENAYVEYEIIGEDASETETFVALTETLVATEPRDYTTFEGTMTLPLYDGATITAVAYVEDECHTASVTLIDGLFFDNVVPDLTYDVSPENLDCIKAGDEIVLHAEAFDKNLFDYDAYITWESTATYDPGDYTLEEELTVLATHVTYDATLTIDATDIDDTFTVTMVATDFCGNTTTESFEFTVDSIAPELDNFAFNAKTNKLWFWLTEDIYPADGNGDVLLTIYVWTGDSDPTEFEPEEGNPVVIGNWNKIVQGTSSDFYDTTEALYYNKDLEHGWMEDILIANLAHDEFNYDLEKDVWYAFVLEEIEDACGNTNALDGFGKARHFSPEF